jgi:DNA-binding NtrC family response regulator
MNTRAPSGRGAATILIVEDDNVVRQVLSEMLLRLGYGVLTAADGAEALAALDAHTGQVDLVMFDTTMPHMSGERLFTLLRQAAPEARTLLTTGYGELVPLEDLRNGGLTGFLPKPFTFQQVKDEVSRVLTRAATGTNTHKP